MSVRIQEALEFMAAGGMNAQTTKQTRETSC